MPMTDIFFNAKPMTLLKNGSLKTLPIERNVKDIHKNQNNIPLHIIPMLNPQAVLNPYQKVSKNDKNQHREEKKCIKIQEVHLRLSYTTCG